MKTFAFLTDIHLDEGLLEDKGIDVNRQWQLLLTDVASRNVEQVIFGGDIGAATAYPAFFESLKLFDSRFIIGNHDTYRKAYKYYTGDITGDGLYYTEKDKEFRYIFMDTSANRVSDRQLHWLKNKLITDRPLLLFIHHPVLPINTPIDSKYPLENRDEVSEAIRSIEGPVFIFSGHYHMEDIQQTDNVVQIVTPASSYQIVKDAPEMMFDTATFGYRLVMLSDDELSTRTVMFHDGEFKKGDLQTFSLAL